MQGLRDAPGRCFVGEEERRAYIWGTDSHREHRRIGRCDQPWVILLFYLIHGPQFDVVVVDKLERDLKVPVHLADAQVKPQQAATGLRRHIGQFVGTACGWCVSSTIADALADGIADSLREVLFKKVHSILQASAVVRRLLLCEQRNRGR